MNVLTVVGHVGRDPELKFTSGGVPICEISLAVATAGVPLLWLKVLCFHALAESCHKQVSKGMLLGISGRLQVRNYRDYAEHPKASVELVAAEVRFFSPKKEDNEK